MSSSRDWRNAVVGSWVLSLTSSSLASSWRVVQNKMFGSGQNICGVGI